MNAAAVQLARLYNLPIYASGGLTESKTPDIQAGFEKNFSNIKVAMAGADFIHLSAGMMDSGKSISYEQYPIDDENIGMITRILKGITITEDTMAFDAIRRVGPGGHFVIEDHTLDHMSELFYPQLSERCSFDLWQEKGQPSMLKRAKSRVTQILDENSESQFDAALIERLSTAFPSLRKTCR